jgi:hypothetical protein
MRTIIFILLSGLSFLMGALVIIADDLGWAISLLTCALIILSVIIAYGSTYVADTTNSSNVVEYRRRQTCRDRGLSDPVPRESGRDPVERV